MNIERGRCQCALTPELFGDSWTAVPDVGCWLWLGRLTQKGYGKLAIRGKGALAHRTSWELHRGPIPKGMNVLHRCDVRSCVNPDHLFIGTQITNIADRTQKKRDAKGEQNGLAKLTEAAVIAIRAATGSRASIGLKFGVHGQTIRQIQRGATWKHLLPDQRRKGQR